MRASTAALLLGLMACTKAGSTSEPISNPPPGAKPPPAATGFDVQITSATLASDCGPTANVVPPPMPAEEAKRSQRPGEAEADMGEEQGKSQYRCEQTSMQLAVTGATSGSPLQVRVKKVELFDDKGTLIGELTSRKPVVWSKDGTYGAWDQTVAASQALSVSYSLSAPDWSKVGIANRWDRNFTVKAVITVGGSDRAVKRDVHISAPAAIPADVET